MLKKPLRLIIKFLKSVVAYSQENSKEIGEEDANALEKIAENMLKLLDEKSIVIDTSALPNFIKNNQKIIDGLLSNDFKERWEAFLELEINELKPRLKLLFPNNDEQATKIEKIYNRESTYCKIANAFLLPFKNFIRAVNTLTYYVNNTYNLNLPFLIEENHVVLSKETNLSCLISKVGLFDEYNPSNEKLQPQQDAIEPPRSPAVNTK